MVNPGRAEETLIKTAEVLDWKIIATTQKIKWTNDLIEKFKDKWGLEEKEDAVLEISGKHHIYQIQKNLWSQLSSNDSIPWTYELLKKYRDNIDWWEISSNPSLQWSIEIIETFFEKFFWQRIIKNPGLIWSKNLVLKFISQFPYQIISSCPFIPWDEDTIKAFVLDSNQYFSYNPNILFDDPLHKHFDFDQSDDYFTALAKNTKLVWNDRMIEIIAESARNQEESHRDEQSNFWYFLSSNPAIRWTMELLRKYKKDIFWSRLSKSESPFWTFEIISEFNEELDWFNLSLNPAIHWSPIEMSKFIDKIQWYMIGENHGAKWTQEAILIYLERLDANGFAVNKQMFKGCIEPYLSLSEIDVYINGLVTSANFTENQRYIIKYLRTYEAELTTFNIQATRLNGHIDFLFHYGDSEDIKGYYNSVDRSGDPRKQSGDWRNQIISRHSLLSDKLILHHFFIKSIDLSYAFCINPRLKTTLDVNKYLYIKATQSREEDLNDSVRLHKVSSISEYSLRKYLKENQDVYVRFIEDEVTDELLLKGYLVEWHNDPSISANLYSILSSKGRNYISHTPFFKMLTCAYGSTWSIEELKRCQESVDWDLLSLNKNLKVDISLIEEFSDNWNWSFLSSNTAIPLEFEFCKRYQSVLNWDKVSANQSDNWSIDFLESFHDLLNFEKLSANPKIVLNETMIKRYYNSFIWDGIIFEESTYDDDYNFRGYAECYPIGKGLSSNIAFPWTNETMGYFEDILDWEYIQFHNIHVRWNIELISAFKYNLKWAPIFDKALDDENKTKRIYGTNISYLEIGRIISSLNFEINLIKEFFRHFDCFTLLQNESIEWDFELFMLCLEDAKQRNMMSFELLEAIAINKRIFDQVILGEFSEICLSFILYDLPNEFSDMGRRIFLKDAKGLA